jgi:hypothetical protein
MTDWTAINRRNARSVQTLIGWIFWDPGVDERLAPLSLPGPLGYIAGRAAPLGPAGADAVIASFYSISPVGIRLAVDAVDQNTDWETVWQARDDAVAAGLAHYVPDVLDDLAAMGPWLWEAVDQLPIEGRTFYAAHLRMPRPDDPVLSAWHAVNCIREWRGDTHWALLVSEEIGPTEAGILHNAWVGYEKDWLPRSRGATDDEITAAWDHLEQRGFARDQVPTPAAVEFREHIEVRTDELTSLPWQVVGQDRAVQFADVAEPACETLLERVDETAGTNYMPASRIHRVG